MKPLLALLLLTSACSSDSEQRSFSQNVGDAFQPCDPAEIRFLATKHNFMTAFDNCGSNHFGQYAWSPDGLHLYFQLTLTHHIMNADAEDKRTITVPVESPTGQAGWLSASRIAIPIGPASSVPGAPERVAVYDIDQNSTFERTVEGYSGIDGVQRGDAPADVFFTAKAAGGERRAYHLDLDDGSVRPAFAWLDTPVTSFEYEPDQRRVAIGRDNTVTLYEAADGAIVGSWTPATRGVLEPEGRWLALEYEGEPISLYFQRAWDELSPRAREREIARVKRFEDRLPDYYPRTITPPSLSMVDLEEDQTRWRITSVQGDHFSWYRARPTYVGLILWGFEGKQLNRNILLGTMVDRMASMAKGEEMMGVERWAPAAAPVEATAPVVTPPSTLEALAPPPPAAQ